jgi:DNA-binding Xre family transcriptional regulator
MPMNKLECSYCTDNDVSVICLENLRYTLGDVMVNKECDEEKLAELIGVDKDNLSDLIHHGRVNLHDFEKICDFLKPNDELKKLWRRHYVVI